MSSESSVLCSTYHNLKIHYYASERCVKKLFLLVVLSLSENEPAVFLLNGLHSLVSAVFSYLGFGVSIPGSLSEADTFGKKCFVCAPNKTGWWLNKPL